MSTATKVLLILGALGLAFVCFVGVVYFGVTRLMKSSEVYIGAIRATTQSPEVVAACDGPVVAGMMSSGSIHTENQSGNADIQIPFTCGKRKGEIHAVATKSDGVWTYATLDVRFDGEDHTIDVRPAQAGSATKPAP